MTQLYRSLDAFNQDKNENSEEIKTDATDHCDDGKLSTAVKNLSIDNKQDDEKHPESTKRKVGYCLNLDPAARLVPFGASIDIRDTVDYKEVMRQHNLGPNGAIMTSLNLFATKFDQVVGILEKRSFETPKKMLPSESITTPTKPNIDYILVDTPGQIEAFTWSASGTIISEGLASSFPTVLAFVVDTPRCASSPNTFMSNMLYACSMLYRTRLPVVVVFNKTDVVSHDFAHQWMTDFDCFQEALDDATSSDPSSSYYTSLTRSLSLVLDQFYSTLKYCGVSAVTGDGLADFWSVVDSAAKEFVTDYIPDLQNRIKEQVVKKQAIARLGLQKLKQDMMDEEDE